MPTATRRTGNGTTLGVDTTGVGTTYTLIGEITNAGISGPAAKVEAVEVTWLSEMKKQFVPGELDPGELTFTLSYDSGSGSSSLLAGQLKLFQTGPIPKWQITFPAVGTGGTPVTETFSGFVTSLSREVKKNEQIVATVGIRVVDDPGYA